MKNRLLNIDGVINLRDLGGYSSKFGGRVRWGQAYRSAQLDRLSEQGINAMRKLNVKTVVDLRFDDETQRYPTLKAGFPDAQFITWRSELTQFSEEDANQIKRSWKESLESGDPAQVREAMRVNYPAKLYSHKGVYRSMLVHLIQDDAPLLFHCAAGKDRTGVAAALILSLLGVSREDIIEDYMVTQSQVAHLLESWVGGGATQAQGYEDFQQKLAQYSREVVQPVFDADIAYIETLMDYVESKYGNFESYAVQVLQLSTDQLSQLRTQLLTE